MKKWIPSLILAFGAAAFSNASALANALAPQQPLVIAHRGFSGVAPENTLIAFQKAIDIGADMLELDVLLSKDGELVVIHDETLERTTNGSGRVADHTLTELKQLDAGSWFSPAFVGERIPTLEEALNLTKGKIRVNIEIKYNAVQFLQFGPGIEAKVVEQVENLGMENDVLISSFHPFALQRIKALNPNLKLAFLYHDPITRNPLDIVGWTGATGFNPNKNHLSLTRLKEAKAAQMPVYIYTVNNPNELKAFVSWGVDGIFTDFPDRLLGLLEQKSPAPHSF